MAAAFLRVRVETLLCPTRAEESVLVDSTFWTINMLTVNNEREGALIKSFSHVRSLSNSHYVCVLLPPPPSRHQQQPPPDRKPIPVSGGGILGEERGRRGAEGTGWAGPPGLPLVASNTGITLKPGTGLFPPSTRRNAWKKKNTKHKEQREEVAQTVRERVCASACVCHKSER